jgi:membrane-bound serine protease (ClpP class)
MNFLLEPNLAYVLLVIGSVLLLLSIVTPGTGLLEIGALFLLALAGYAVYNLGFNLWALIVLVLSIFPFVYAMRRPRRELALALSILGVTLGSVYLFEGEDFVPAVNPILAIVVSLLAAGFLWLVVRKTIAAHLMQPSHDLGALLGQFGEAKTAVHEEGSAQVAGELWSVRSEKTIPAGSRVRVVGREGFILVVELDDQK